MPTFIDESGDTGHASGSLPYFRLAALWMPSLTIAEDFRAGVRHLRRTLHLDESLEFKFSRTHAYPARRDAFLRCALRHPFHFSFCGIDKTQGHWRTAPGKEQHWAAATSLAACLRSVYRQAESPAHPLREPILVDDNEDQSFLKAIAAAFRGLRSPLHPNAGLVGKPRFRGSAPDEVMQLVDMICGATGAYLDGDPTWYELIQERCVGLIRLP